MGKGTPKSLNMPTGYRRTDTVRYDSFAPIIPDPEQEARLVRCKDCNRGHDVTLRRLPKEEGEPQTYTCGCKSGN